MIMIICRWKKNHLCFIAYIKSISFENQVTEDIQEFPPVGGEGAHLRETDILTLLAMGIYKYVFLLQGHLKEADIHC